MEYIQKMGVVHLYNLVERAREKIERQELYQLYCAIYPMFDKKSFKSFDDFYQEHRYRDSSYKQTTKSNDEIMNELLNRKE